MHGCITDGPCIRDMHAALIGSHEFVKSLLSWYSRPIVSDAWYKGLISSNTALLSQCHPTPLKCIYINYLTNRNNGVKCHSSQFHVAVRQLYNNLRWRQNAARLKTWHTPNGNVRSQKPLGITFTFFLSCWFNTSLTSFNFMSICLLLRRYYIYSCKYKHVPPFSIEYVNHVRCNLKIKNPVSIIKGTQNAFQQKCQ